MPRDRSKTLTALVGAEPLVQAQAAEAQRLQFFPSEATWDAEAIPDWRRAASHCADAIHPVIVGGPCPQFAVFVDGQNKRTSCFEIGEVRSQQRAFDRQLAEPGDNGVVRPDPQASGR